MHAHVYRRISQESIACGRLIDEKSSSIVSFIMKKIVPTVWSTYAAFTRFFWQENSFEQQPPVEVTPQDFGKGKLGIRHKVGSLVNVDP